MLTTFLEHKFLLADDKFDDLILENDSQGLLVPALEDNYQENYSITGIIELHLHVS